MHTSRIHNKSVRLSVRTLLFFFIALVQLCTAHAATAGTADSISHHRRNSIAYEGFIGGMMIHTGYVWAKGLELSNPSGLRLPHTDIKGMPLGIGGALKVQFGKHFRIGTEGYSTRLNYGKKGSSSHIGWGGLLMDAIWETGKFTFFAGGTIGGGGTTNITLTEDYGMDEITEQNVSFRKYSFMSVCPFIGFEYALTQKINFTVKTDWLINITNRQKDFPTGPRLYIGIMFKHKRMRK